MSEIENLDEYEDQGSLETNVNLSNVYSVRKGGFGFHEQINTFLTTLDVDQLKNDVQFYETLSTEKDWPVSQIIQREVDKARVNAISKVYILGKGRTVKYFPPIIVALLPREENGSFAKAFNFNVDDETVTKEHILDKSIYRKNAKFRELLLSKTNQSLVDGFYEFTTSEIFEHHLVCWDKSKFFAVVIDGQHRLDALLKSAEDDSTYFKAKQDVLFLDVSPLVKAATDLTPVEVLRTVFIDINTNARSVGIVRRILMDDKDLASLCVQSMVESVYKNGTSKRDDEFIPSVLIDWYGESIKHELPHITGLITLHQIITDQLADKKMVSIEHHREPKHINDFIENLNSTFFVDKTIAVEGEFRDVTPLSKSFTEYLNEKEINRETFAEEVYDEDDEEIIDSVLFTYDYRVLEVAQKNFEKYYLKPMINVFTKFQPYEKVTEWLRGKRAFDPTSNLYRALLLPVRKVRAEENLKNIYLTTRRELFDYVNSNYFLFYSVVGQKGLFWAFFELLDKKFVEGSDEGTVLEVQTSFIDLVNETLSFMDNKQILLFGKESFGLTVDDDYDEYGTVASSFWEGILYENGRIIHNSQGVRAFADILFFITSIYSDLKAGRAVEANENYSIRFSTARTRRLLVKGFGMTANEEWDEVAKVLLANKKKYIIDLFTSSFVEPAND